MIQKNLQCLIPDAGIMNYARTTYLTFHLLTFYYKMYGSEKHGRNSALAQTKSYKT